MIGFICAVAGVFALHAAKPTDFTPSDIEATWTGLWKQVDPKISEPKIDKLSETEVTERLKGKWTVLFGVMPDKMTITIRTNRLVEVSGQKEGKDWKNDGEWRVLSGKLVLFLEHDTMQSFIFRIGQHLYIFDPWAKTYMSELTREK